MTSGPLVLFRCDASPNIGAGHVSRCLALAEAFAEAGWQIRFVVGAETVSTAPALSKRAYAVHVLAGNESDVEALRAQASEGADLLVVDHYGREAAFEMACRAFARKIFVLDDATGRRHDCDILVDAAAPSAESYAGLVPAHARLLTGPDYALLGRAFLVQRAAALARRDGRPVAEILVSCGATDPANATEVVLDVLAEVAPSASVTVVLSSTAPHAARIRARAGGNFRLILDAENMADLMANADFAIGAPGNMAFERAALGLPSIQITLADNQRGVARLLVEAGAALDAGAIDDGLALRLRGLLRTLLADGAERNRLGQAGSRLVDGRGATRIMLAALGPVATKDDAPVSLRLADTHDEGWLLDLQRQPDLRRYFRNPAVPGAEEHHQWMERTLADPDRLLLIVECNGAAAGMLRLDRLPDRDGMARREVSIAVDSNCAKRGVGSAALALARRLLPCSVLEAEILPENRPSERAFARAGFRPAGANRYVNLPSTTDANRAIA